MLAMSFTASPLMAVDFNIEFQDTSSGIDWSGVVDTTADTLSITDWTVTGNSLYPAVISDGAPMVFDAVSGDNGSFDVPDSWDGSLNNWGFLSRLGWLQYSWTNKSQQEGGDFSFSATNNNKIGLGVIEFDGGARIVDGQEVTGNQRNYSSTPAFTDSANGRTATPTTFTATPVPVPEPSSVMLLFVGAAGLLTHRKR